MSLPPRSPASFSTHRACRAAAAALTALALAGSSAQAHGQELPRTLATFLEHDIGLSRDQIVAVRRAQPVVKVLDARNPRDVAVFGIVPIAVPRAALVERLTDFPRSLSAPTRTRLGVFSTPPAGGDVAELQLTSKDLGELRSCRPGSCNFKIPATDMAELQARIDWKARDAAEQAAAYARRRMVEYVADYRKRGNEAMLVYADRGAVRASDAFADLLADSPYLYQYAPTFHRYLRDYPRATLAGASEVVFWSRDEMPGVRPVTSITHTAIYSPPELPGATVIGSKQLFATHYFEAAFELVTLVDRAPADSSAGVYALVLRRYRFDDLPSGGLLNIKGRVTKKLRDQTEADLRRMKGAAEATRTTAAR